MVTVGGPLPAGGGSTPCWLAATSADGFVAADTRADEPPRSSSPPVPPACPRAWSTHGQFQAQVDCCARPFDLAPGAVNMPTFRPPPVRSGAGPDQRDPDMDPTRFRRARRPGENSSPRSSATASACCSAPPALLDTLSRRAAHGLGAAGVRRVMSAAHRWRRPSRSACASAWSPRRVFTPYGARTPARGGDREPRGAGRHAHRRRTRRRHLRGRPLAANTARIIGIDDAPIATWSDDAAGSADGAVGESPWSAPPPRRFTTRGQQARHWRRSNPGR